MIYGISGATLDPALPGAGFFNRICSGANVPPKLLYAIAQRETLSSMSLEAACLCVSDDNGHGVMQLTSSWPETWSDLSANLSFAITEFVQPALRYWHGLERESGDRLVKLVAATYNEGLSAAVKYHLAGNVDAGTTNDYGEGVLANYLALCR